MSFGVSDADSFAVVGLLPALHSPPSGATTGKRGASTDDMDGFRTVSCHFRRRRGEVGAKRDSSSGLAPPDAGNLSRF